MFDTKDNGMGVSLLRYFCQASYGQIAEMFNATLDSKNNIFVPSENDSKVLFVAHMDVVTDKPRFSMLEDKNTLISSKFDDRLGIYAAYVLKYKYKFDFDILLTDEEERCNSSAQFFKTDKKYNWMFQFDRAGNNHAVCYQYESDEAEKALNAAGLQMQMGSYSDICELSHLGCLGFNFAVAYYKQHSPNCYMKIDEYKNQLRKFMKFYNLHKDTHMPFDADAYEKAYKARQQKFYDNYKSTSYGYGVSRFYDDEYYDWYYGKHTSEQTKAIEIHENEKIIANVNKMASATPSNEGYWEEANQLKNFRNKSHTVKRPKGETKVIDFRQAKQDFEDENDRQLNEYFGGIVEKNGVMVRIVWRGGVAFYEPLNNNFDEMVGAPKPEVGSRDWYLELPADFEEAELEKQVIEANKELDKQMEFAMSREI
jgi:hypothetical protein